MEACLAVLLWPLRHAWPALHAASLTSKAVVLRQVRSLRTRRCATRCQQRERNDGRRILFTRSALQGPSAPGVARFLAVAAWPLLGLRAAGLGLKVFVPDLARSLRVWRHILPIFLVRRRVCA